MASIRAIGFDMDHTLAIYDRENFEELAFNITLEKFIEAGYPKDLLSLKFNPNFIIRGLLVDINRGNILKVDGHKYVKVAYHGRKKLDRETRRSLYNSQSYKADDFVSVDTFFALSEIQLYADIVDYMARNPGVISKTFEEVYRDIKYFIDLSHKDGTIKTKVLRNLPKYVKKDDGMIEALIKLKEAGKKLFLLTNSYWDYTNQIMAYILSKGKNHTNHQWLDIFDFVIVGSSKPGFFVGSQPFFEVLPDTGHLRIHDGLSLDHKIFHGGNAKLLERISSLRGDEVLYVGDHIYGDIIHSKHRFNWRTLLIIDELDFEFKNLSNSRKTHEEIQKLILEREMLEEQHHYIVKKVETLYEKGLATPHKEYREKVHSQKLSQLQQELSEKTEKISKITEEIDALLENRSFTAHPFWGELMRTGLERSRLAEQVIDYACLYSSKVSNLRYYSPFKKFTSAKELLPHEIS